MNATTLLDRLNALLPAMQARAAALDASASFPSDDIAELRTAGVLAAAVPGRFGGLGIGTEPQAAGAALDMFRALGRGNLALGRLVEAHVNALRRCLPTPTRRCAGSWRTMRKPGICAGCG